MSAKVTGGPGSSFETAYVVEGAERLSDGEAAIRSFVESTFGPRSYQPGAATNRITYRERLYELREVRVGATTWRYVWFDVTQPARANENADTKPHRTPSGTFRLGDKS